MEKLANVMGHSSVVVTERYAHLGPDLFREEDYELLDVDLLPAAKVVPTGQGKGTVFGAIGNELATKAAFGVAEVEVSS